MDWLDSVLASVVGGTFVVAILAVVLWLSKAFVGAYLAKAGEAAAERRWVKEIASLEEEGKASGDLRRANLQSVVGLRAAAIETRLAKHQEAFSLWQELRADLNTERLWTTIGKCQNWWDNNALYLERTARESFQRALTAASDYHTAQDILDPDVRLPHLKKNWDLILAVGNDIEIAVGLPPLQADQSEDNYKQYRDKISGKDAFRA